MFTERTRYILRLLLYLGKEHLEIYRTVEDLSKETGIPGPYLGKLVGLLSEKGYLDTRKGPAGGVTLEQDPSELRIDKLLLDIGEYNHTEELTDTCCLPDVFEECFVKNTIDMLRDTVIKEATLKDVIDDLEPA